MSAKHTPGPWDAPHADNVISARQGWVLAGDDDLIASAIDHPDIEANARLIAAAPELLEALQVLMEKCINPEEFRYLKAGIGTRAPNGKALLAALAAIAKATGEPATIGG